MTETKNIRINQLLLNTGQIEGLPKNPRFIKDERYEALKKSIEDSPEMLSLRELIVYPHEDKFVVIGGNMRLRACKELGHKEIPCKVLDVDTPAKKLREYTLKDNVAFGQDDFDALANEWDVEELEDCGVELPDVAFDGDCDDEAEETEKEEHNKLTDLFGVPPFTILDTRQGYWNDRKRIWKDLINDNGESRQGTLSESELMGGINSGVSILDPVMAEIVCKWFGIEGGKAFDCFAGDSVFGYVASYLGMQFTGIELREEQAKLNNERIKGFNSKYINDDGQNVLNHIEKKTQDLFFSCPPYYDLEVYSDKENDASNQETYEDFLVIIKNAFEHSIECMKDNRFMVVVCGDVRDKKSGFYYDFPADIKQIFKNKGVKLYNEAVLIEPIGTLPQRVGRYMGMRKLGKCHQNILIFYKGDPKSIKDNYKEIKFDNIELLDNDSKNLE